MIILRTVEQQRRGAEGAKSESQVVSSKHVRRLRIEDASPLLFLCFRVGRGRTYGSIALEGGSSS